MAAAVARVGDVVVGVCRGPGHVTNRPFTGVWLTGSDVSRCDDMGVVRIGDVGVTDCNHHFIAITGSDVSRCDDAAVHRVGDVVQVVEGGEGTTITGSETASTE